MKKELKCKNILESTLDDIYSGKISIREARERMYRAGWFNYIPDEDELMKLLLNYKNRFGRKNKHL